MALEQRTRCVWCGCGCEVLIVRLPGNYVRFTPDNGHSRQSRQCPLIANNGHSANANKGLALGPSILWIGIAVADIMIGYALRYVWATGKLHSPTAHIRVN